MASASSLRVQPAAWPGRYAWRFGNAQARTYTHDTDSRLTQLAGASLHSLSYGWNNTDTMASLTDAVSPALNASFGYDPSDRLNAVHGDGSGDASLTMRVIAERGKFNVPLALHKRQGRWAVVSAKAVNDKGETVVIVE